jgi:NAD(P)-dependent dehydrogenase (short-subunit alcohol dehydrogenase family)
MVRYERPPHAPVKTTWTGSFVAASTQTIPLREKYLKAAGRRPIATATHHCGTLRCESRVAIYSRIPHAGSIWKRLGRFGRPEEGGDVVAYLASSRASWISGTSVVVDGCHHSEQ